MIFNGIMLTCCAQINGERTIQSIYHLLTGKRSIQTVLDSHLYQLNHLYGVYRHLDIKTFNQTVADLVSQQYILPGEQDKVFLLTRKGHRWLAKHEEKLKLSVFQGSTYHRVDGVFLARLILLIQVLANQRMKHTSYIPVIDQDSITNWVKKTYKDLRPNLDQTVQQLYRELHDILSLLTDHEASMFVHRLTGYQKIGLSIQQLSHIYQMREEAIQLILTRIVHRMIVVISANPTKYQLLAYILQDLTNQNLLTHSANETYQLVKQGYPLHQIASMRRLKMNTIYDHIVEIALYDQTFPIDSYVSSKEKTVIIQAVKQANSTKLKTIKQHVGENISYFQIRLVLTRYVR